MERYYNTLNIRQSYDARVFVCGTVINNVYINVLSRFQKKFQHSRFHFVFFFVIRTIDKANIHVDMFIGVMAWFKKKWVSVVFKINLNRVNLYKLKN